MSVDMATTFRQAADVIRTGGWVQDTLFNEEGYCTLGAVIAATNTHGLPDIALEGQLLARMLGYDAATTSWVGKVSSWNDAPGRNPGDVITLLEQAAEKLEADL